MRFWTRCSLLNNDCCNRDGASKLSAHRRNLVGIAFAICLKMSESLSWSMIHDATLSVIMKKEHNVLKSLEVSFARGWLELLRYRGIRLGMRSGQVHSSPWCIKPQRIEQYLKPYFCSAAIRAGKLKGFSVTSAASYSVPGSGIEFLTPGLRWVDQSLPRTEVTIFGGVKGLVNWDTVIGLTNTNAKGKWRESFVMHLPTSSSFASWLLGSSDKQSWMQSPGDCQWLNWEVLSVVLLSDHVCRVAAHRRDETRQGVSPPCWSPPRRIIAFSVFHPTRRVPTRSHGRDRRTKKVVHDCCVASPSHNST